MKSECCECDRPSARFWGGYAYCRRHLAEAMREEPAAHQCPSCGREQPAHVLWRRDGRCRECREENGDVFVP